MKKGKIREALVEKLLGVSFFGVGVLVLAAGLITALFSLHFQKQAVRVDALVTAVDTGTEVKYQYEGQEYTVWLSAYSSSIREGSTVTLYVDAADPECAKLKSLLYLPTIILCSVGGPFAVLGAVFLLLVFRKSRKKKKLMESGRQVWAEVTGGNMNYNYSLNNRHPWRLECSYTDAGTGNTYLYRSGNIFVDPQLYVGRQIAVFVDPADFSRYYVDVESLEDIETGIYDFR